MEAHASIINHNEFDVVSPRDWAAHQAAQDLMNAMSRVLLPDISYLSFEEVKDLQERSLDELEPMRADMLRATVDLRDMLRDLHGDEWTTEDFLKEAENIIATRVEPSVRELASRIKSDVKLTALDYAG
jgi:hypothetical protein